MKVIMAINQNFLNDKELRTNIAVFIELNFFIHDKKFCWAWDD